MGNDNQDIISRETGQETLRRWGWVVIFGIAFAWVEGAVVVYLREIYFGGAFCFPVVKEWEEGSLFLDNLVRVEFMREIATLIMLLAVGFLAGKNPLQRFCFFMITFGVWDIFYYIWLRVMCGWPRSLMTWDLLFFVPLPWVGPVITPLLIALAMLAAGSSLIYYEEKGYVILWRWYDWVIECWCGLLVITAFCWDWKNIIRLPDAVLNNGIPNSFAWWLYLPAYTFSVVYFGVRLRRILTRNSSQGSVAMEPEKI